MYSVKTPYLNPWKLPWDTNGTTVFLWSTMVFPWKTMGFHVLHENSKRKPMKISMGYHVAILSPWSTVVFPRNTMGFHVLNGNSICKPMNSPMECHGVCSMTWSSMGFHTLRENCTCQPMKTSMEYHDNDHGTLWYSRKMLWDYSTETPLCKLRSLPWNAMMVVVWHGALRSLW